MIDIMVCLNILIFMMWMLDWHFAQHRRKKLEAQLRSMQYVLAQKDAQILTYAQIIEDMGKNV